MPKIKFTVNSGPVPEVDEEKLEKAIKHLKEYIEEHNADPEAWYIIQDILIAGPLEEGEDGLDMFLNIIFMRKTENKETQYVSIMLGDDEMTRIEDVCEQRKMCDELSDIPSCHPMIVVFSEPEDNHMRSQFPAYISIKVQEAGEEWKTSWSV